MNVRRLLIGGITGGVAMTLLGVLVRATGVDMNAEMMLGTMFATPDHGAWIIGFAMHMMFSVFFAVIYAWAFEHITHRAGLVVGLGFAVVHIVIAGLAMALLPAVHPMMPEKMMAPGAFMAGMGAIGVGLFILEHLIYGGIVGATYGPAQHVRSMNHHASVLRSGG
jgi:hypothetical protein